MGKFIRYYSHVEEQAKDLVEDIKVQIIEEAEEGAGIYDTIDQYVHEWVDNDMIYVNLHDCADILDQSSNVETDSGLWDGLEPIRAIESMTFFTYRADLIEEVKDHVVQLIEERISEAEEKVEELESEMKDLDKSEEEDINAEAIDQGTEAISEIEEKIEEKIDELTDQISNMESANEEIN